MKSLFLVSLITVFLQTPLAQGCNGGMQMPRGAFGQYTTGINYGETKSSNPSDHKR